MFSMVQIYVNSSLSDRNKIIILGKCMQVQMLQLLELDGKWKQSLLW